MASRRRALALAKSPERTVRRPSPSNPTLRAQGDGVEWFPLEEAEVQTVSIEVAALADEAPSIDSARGEGLQLIVPESVAAYQSFGNDAPIFYGYFDAADGDHSALTEELATAGSAYFHDKSPYGLAFYSFNDYIEQRDSNQMIATVVNVFCLLFAVILALIAMANVFNTVTNSLILRRREFAVMKSVGLSNRQFRAMVAEECVACASAASCPACCCRFSCPSCCGR